MILLLLFGYLINNILIWVILQLTIQRNIVLLTKNVIACLYFSVRGLLAIIADKYIIKLITKIPPMVFILISVIGIIFYILMMILHYACANGNIIFYIISDKPYIFIILGVIMYWEYEFRL